MSIFNRVKKEEKLSETQAKPAAVPQGKGLEDFHPLDTGLGQAVWELRQEYEGEEKERKSCTRDQFLALLAGVPALRKTPGIPSLAELGQDYYVTLPRCASAEDAAACRNHLREIFGIEDKATLLEFCNRELRCQNQYLDFEGFWEGRAPFSLAALNDGAREFFETARDFSAQFYEVTSRQGFLAWDISECMGHLRVGYACGLLNREEFDEMAEYWIVQAQCFRSWAQFAVSLVCGELYWDFRQGADLPKIQEDQKLWLRLVRQLLDNENAWGSGLWYTPPRKKEYRFWPSELRTFLTDWKGPTGCFATDHITVLGKQVGWCYREEPDGDYPDSGWRFFSGEEDDDYVNDLSHTDVYDLNEICNCDPSIIPLLSAPCGTAFMRGRDGKFHAEQYIPQDE